jgi:hypothetical protein
VNIPTNNAVPDIYPLVKTMAMSGTSWIKGLLTTLVCGGVSMDQMGDRAAMQVLNEMFFGAGSQNYDYYANIQYPSANNHAAWAWPQTISPGPTPDGIYNAHTGQKLTGQSAGSTWTCTCPYGYAYNTSTGTCVPPAVTAVVDWGTGDAWSAHGASYIEIFGTGFSVTNNVVWLGTTNLQVTYNSPTQINAYVPTTVAVGAQSLQVTNPSVGSAFATVTAYPTSASTITGEYNAITYAGNDAQVGNYFTVWGTGLSGCSQVRLGGVNANITYTSGNQINAIVSTSTYAGWQPMDVYCNGSWTNWWAVNVHY